MTSIESGKHGFEVEEESRYGDAVRFNDVKKGDYVRIFYKDITAEKGRVIKARKGVFVIKTLEGIKIPVYGGTVYAITHTRPESYRDMWENVPWGQEMIYEKSLPPVSPKTEVVTVVPVFNEFQSGHFWRLLDGATSQSADVDTFETILVVNNGTDDVKEETKAYEDNQKLLIVANALQKATESKRKNVISFGVEEEMFNTIKKEKIKITDFQKNLLQEALKKKVRFYAVDASSKNRAPHVRGDVMRQFKALMLHMSHRMARNSGRSSEKEPVHKGYYNIIGISRHIGGKIAYNRLQKTNNGDEGLIDFIDADCGTPGNYVKEVLNTDKDKKESDVFIKDLMTYAPDVPVWQRSKPLRRTGFLLHYLRQNITMRLEIYLSSEKGGIMHGPAPMVRAKFFREMDGYPFRVPNEDFAFANKITESTDNISSIQNTHIRLADRTSVSSTDGNMWQIPFVSPRRTRSVRSFAKYFNPENIKTLENGVYTEFIKDILLRDKDNEDDDEYKTFRAKRWSEEVHKSKRRVASLRRSVRALMDIKTNEIRRVVFDSPEGLREWLYDHRSTSKLKPEEIEYLVENPTIVSAVMTARALVRTKRNRDILGLKKKKTKHQTVYSFFEKYLPEYFLVLPEEEPDYHAMIISIGEHGKLPEGCSLRMMTHLIKAARDIKTS